MVVAAAVLLLPLVVLPGTWRQFDLPKLVGAVVTAALLLPLAGPGLREGWRRSPPEAKAKVVAV